MILERELMEEEYIVGFGERLNSIKHNLYEISALVNRFDLISEEKFYDTTYQNLYRERFKRDNNNESNLLLEGSIRTYNNSIKNLENSINSKKENLEVKSVNFNILEKHTLRLIVTSIYLNEYISLQNNQENYLYNFNRFVPILETAIESYNTMNQLKNFYDRYIDKKKATRNLFPHLLGNYT